jgi:hypothetical protein
MGSQPPVSAREEAVWPATSLSRGGVLVEGREGRVPGAGDRCRLPGHGAVPVTGVVQGPDLLVGWT